MTRSPVLILDGHTTQALACVRSLGQAGRRTLVASSGRWPLAAASRWSDGHRRIREDTVAHYAALREWARRRGVTAVLTMTERSCLIGLRRFGRRRVPKAMVPRATDAPVGVP